MHSPASGVHLRVPMSGSLEVQIRRSDSEPWQEIDRSTEGYWIPAGARLSVSLRDLADSPADLALVAELPPDQLVGLGLSWCEGADDELMERVAEFLSLEGLGIGLTAITDTGLAKLSGLRALRSISAFATHITGAGFADLTGSPLEHLGLDASDIDDAGLTGIGRLSSLVRLDLERTSVTDHGIPSLAGCRALSELALRETNVAGETLGRLALLPIRELDLSGCPLTAQGVASVLSLDQLRVLSLHETNVEDGWLPEPSSWPPLEYLGLSKTKIGPAAGSLVGQLTSLQRLGLGGAQIGDEGVGQLGGLGALTYLHIGNVGVSGPGLAALEPLRALQTLYAFQNPLTEDAFVHLGRLEALRGLFLSHVALDGAWLRHLAGLTGLQTLDLRATGISSDDLAPIAEMASLHELHLQGNPGIDDEAVEHIGRLPNLSAFSTVNTGITDAGRERLRDLLPDCRLR